MAVTDIAPPALEVGDEPHIEPRPQPTPVERVLGTGDHKTIGRLFIGASLIFLALDFAAAALVHFDIASGGEILGFGVAGRLFTNHIIGLMLCGVVPLLLGLAVYLVPLQVGSPTISFPRAAALSFWAWLVGSLLFGLAIVVKGGYGGSSVEMSRLGNVSIGLITLALLVPIVCVMTTVLSLRAPGMTVARTPYFSFSMLVAGAVWLGTLPAVFAGVVLWHIQQPTPATLAGGAATMEWLFRQPSIWVIAVPVLGIMLDVASAAAKQRVRFSSALQYALIAAGVLSFGTWAQYPFSRETFVWLLGSLVVGLPLLVVLGGVADTVRQGKPKPSASLVMVLSAAPLFLLAAAFAAVQGVATARKGNLFDLAIGGFATVTDRTGLTAEGGPGMAVGQTYLIIAAVTIVGVAACFAWGTRLFAGGLPDGLGKALAPLGLLGGVLLGVGHIVLGIARPDEDAVKAFVGIAGVGALFLMLFVLGAAAAVIAAATGRFGQTADADDDSSDTTRGGTLEWLTASPPVDGNFDGALPTIESPWPLFDRDETGADAR